MNKFLPMLKFEANNNKESKIKTIYDNAIYAKKADKHLLGLYYLVVWKSYSIEKNT